MPNTSVESSDIVRGLEGVRRRIAEACERSGRAPSRVTLVAVSKQQGVEAIIAAYDAGQRDFGENYVQELVKKAEALSHLEELRWWFVGRLQRNKVKALLAAGVGRITVDSVRVVEAIAARQQPVTLDIQVNLAGEPQKAGCDVAALPEVLARVRAANGLSVGSLMTIPPAGANESALRQHFDQMRALAQQHRVEGLSMGMSDDFEIAIEHGATAVRVGRAIFGTRPR